MADYKVFDASLGILIFESLKDFYEDRGGRISGESDFGAWNKDDMMVFSMPEKSIGDRVLAGVGIIVSAAQNRPLRVSVVAETGDVYAFEERLPSRVALLGNLGIKDEGWRSGGLGGKSAVYEKAELAFEGWAMDSDGSFGRPLSWFVKRLREAT